MGLAVSSTAGIHYGEEERRRTSSLVREEKEREEGKLCMKIVCLSLCICVYCCLCINARRRREREREREGKKERVGLRRGPTHRMKLGCRARHAHMRIHTYAETDDTLLYACL